MIEAVEPPAVDLTGVDADAQRELGDRAFVKSLKRRDRKPLHAGVARSGPGA